jgi:hypothetical protein
MTRTVDCLKVAPRYTPVAHMGTPGPAEFEVKDQAPTTLVVTTSDGRKYDVTIAMMVLSVFDQGTINPLDKMPIIQVASQQFMQVKPHADG